MRLSALTRIHVDRSSFCRAGKSWDMYDQPKLRPLAEERQRAEKLPLVACLPLWCGCPVENAMAIRLTTPVPGSVRLKYGATRCQASRGAGAECPKLCPGGTPGVAGKCCPFCVLMRSLVYGRALRCTSPKEQLVLASVEPSMALRCLAIRPATCCDVLRRTRWPLPSLVLEASGSLWLNNPLWRHAVTSLGAGACGCV